MDEVIREKIKIDKSPSLNRASPFLSQDSSSDDSDSVEHGDEKVAPQSFSESPASPNFARRSTSRSPSPEPPQPIIWQSPPSPFLKNVYAPERALRKTPRQTAFSRKPGRASANLSAPFHQGLRLKKLREDGFMDAAEHQRHQREKTRKFFEGDLFDKSEKPILTNEVALQNLAAVTSSEFFDPEIALYSDNKQFRKKRVLRLVRPGTFERKAHVLRAKILTKDLEKVGNNEDDGEEEIDEEFGFFKDDGEKDGEAFESNKASEQEESAETHRTAQNSHSSAKESQITFLADLQRKKDFSVEWWDKDLLKVENYDLLDDNFVREMVTSYVQHPLKVKPVLNKKGVAPVPLYLTVREKKKARRMKKRAKLEIQAERVRLGLEEPPDPRVSMANIMRVLGNSAVQDPSAVERQVRAKVEKRKMAHLLHNELRKQTPAERRAKKRKRLVENLSNGVHVAVFFVETLSDSKTRFKVDVTASQYNLSGCGVVCPKGNAVVVEGGPNGIRKFKHLVLKRVGWRKEADSFEGGEEGDATTEDEGMSDADKGNICVWEGIVPKRAFSMFTMEACKTEKAAQLFFRKNKVSQYWDICSAVKAERDYVNNERLK